MKYDIIIVGAGPGGIFASYELVKKNPEEMCIRDRFHLMRL